MKELTARELKVLIKLVEKEREGIRLKSYEDKETHRRYIDLGMISVKLEAQSMARE